MIYCLEKKQRTQLLLLYNFTKKDCKLTWNYISFNCPLFLKKILEKWKRQMRLSLDIMLLNGTKVGKRLPTHRTHMWRKSRSPSTVSKSPPLPLKGSPFPPQNTLPLPPPPFSYKSLLLSRERKATGIYIIKISLDIQRSLRGFSNRFKISVRLGWYTIL